VPRYIDIIAPESEEQLELMVSRAISLGFGAVGIVGDFPDLPNGTFRVSIVGPSSIPQEARKIRSKVRLLLSSPKTLEESRKVTFSKLVDGVVASYDTGRPNFDYVSAKLLKRNEGTLLVPVAWMIRKMLEEPHVIRNVRLEVRIALKAGLYPVIASMARDVREIVPPRLLVSFGEFILDLRRDQAKSMVKDFPSYLISEERKLRTKGVALDEVQGSH